jgi:hypothetical protein
MDSFYCQTFAVSPAEPGDFPLLVKNIFKQIVNNDLTWILQDL